MNGQYYLRLQIIIYTFNPIITTYLYMRSFHTTHPYFKHVGIILLQHLRERTSNAKQEKYLS